MTTLPPSPHAPAYAGVDLVTCEEEPIHIPGAIQPHGVLLALDTGTSRRDRATVDDLVVVVASANTQTLLGLPVEAVVGRSLREVVGARVAELVLERWRDGIYSESLVTRYPGPDELPEGAGAAALARSEVDLSLHESGDRLVLEIETYGRPRSVLLSYQSARSAMARLSAAGSVTDLADRLAHEIRDLTAFDRVMVYRFDPEWNGEVIAEARRDDLNSFLGLHYPAGDIPAQARRLYTVNWTRLIADVSYTPVPLEPMLDPVTRRPLDLSGSTLRSVSPIHIEYLQNMGVTASMSVSLVHNDRLWGLVACHHYSGPHRPSQDARAAAEFLGQVASADVAEREAASVRGQLLAAGATLSRIMTRLSGSTGTLGASLAQDDELLDLLDAGGMAFFYDGELSTRGEVPSARDLTLIVRRLSEQAPSSLQMDTAEVVSHTDNLVSLDHSLSDVGAAGGLLLTSDAGWWLLWVRPPLARVVDWGGDPHNKELAALEDGRFRLSPRKSFETWSEIVKDRSAPWTDAEVDTASTLQHHLGTLVFKRAADQVAVAQSLQRSVVGDWQRDVRDLRLAVNYQPASSYQLGGDWWDLVELEGDRAVVVVGDVAGHGVSAVAAMTQVRAALRAYLFAGLDAAAAVDQLDHLMVRMFDARVASVVVATVDRSRRVAEVVVAGHPRPILSGSGDLSQLDDLHVRPVLGLGQGRARATEVDLSDGTLLVVFTDGVVERRGQDLAANMDLLQMAARRGPGAGVSLQEWVDELPAAVPGSTDDDITLLAFGL